MKYVLFDTLESLKADGMITARRHSIHPITIYNYSAKAQHTPLAEWTEAMKDCRGLILDDEGEIVGRPFRKFWNMEQVADQIPNEPFQVWEKLDGSLGIVCSYAGERIVATRGSFESDQAIWFRRWLDTKFPDFTPSGETYLFEIIFPGNRIVVDYGDRKEGVLLTVMSPDGVDLQMLFNGCKKFRKARRFDGMTEFDSINSDPQFAGAEGFVIQFESGFRCKVKIEEYKRLHRLITQCSTRTIWELLKVGTGIQELLDRVPEEFAEWVISQSAALGESFAAIDRQVNVNLLSRPVSGVLASGHVANAEERSRRKEFAKWAFKNPWPHQTLARASGFDITDQIWEQVEPKWATPFRKDIDA